MIPDNYFYPLVAMTCFALLYGTKALKFLRTKIESLSVEKDFLKKLIVIDGGGVDSDRLYGLAGNDNERRLIQKLLSVGHIETFSRIVFTHAGDHELTFFRVSKKGHELFDTWFVRIWEFFTDGMAKILSLIALIISILVGLHEMGWL